MSEKADLILGCMWVLWAVLVLPAEVSITIRNRSSSGKGSKLTALLNENKGKFSSNSHPWHDGGLLLIRSGVRLSSLTGNHNALPSHHCSPCLRIKLLLHPSRCVYFTYSEVVAYSHQGRPLIPALPGGTALLSLVILMFLNAGPFCGSKGDLEDKKKQLPSQCPSALLLLGWLCPYTSGQ